MDLLENARRYLKSVPPAISGSGGHNQMYSAAVALVNGFALNESDALALLNEYNQTCQPPFSPKDVKHKIDTAISTPHQKERGHLLKGRTQSAPRSMPSPAVKAAPAPSLPPARIEIDDSLKLPTPIADGTRELLRAVFKHGEGVRIAKATLNEEGKENPADGGATLTREEWLAKLDAAKGNPNSFMTSAKRCGIYIAVNPCRGAFDNDITDYARTLIEFDDLPQERQYGLYIASRLPCAAIIRSGGKSIHAWIKIGAKDLAEYRERVAFLHQWLESAGYKSDPKNKNPNRFSRLPNCYRFKDRQELLALNTGVESFSAWLAEIESAGIGKTSTLDDLLQINTEADPDCLLGKRYLCRRGAWLITGPSGVGKSSLCVQAAILWAMGRPFCGIKPTKPLKSMFYQAENDDGDLSEMVRGVLDGLEIDYSFETSDYDLFKQNIVFVSDATRTGDSFLVAVQRQIDKHKPDLVWIDPAAAFVGEDLGRQTTIASFFRKGLGSISEATGVTWMVVNHTTKPPTDAKARSGWTSSDHQYSGAGSYDLPGWARAVCNLRQVNEFNFELKLTKRGKRAGATHPNGEPALSLWLKHAEKGITWVQVEPPEEQPWTGQGGKDKPAKEPKKSKVEILASKNLHEVLSKIPAEGESANGLGERFLSFSKKHGCQLGLTKCRTDLIDLLIERGMLEYNDVTNTYKKGKNA